MASWCAELCQKVLDSNGHYCAGRVLFLALVLRVLSKTSRWHDGTSRCARRRLIVTGIAVQGGLFFLALFCDPKPSRPRPTFASSDTPPLAQILGAKRPIRFLATLRFAPLRKKSPGARAYCHVAEGGFLSCTASKMAPSCEPRCFNLS